MGNCDMLHTLYTDACFPPCVKGECTGPDICSCHTGWTGEACNEGTLKVRACVLYNIVVAKK